MLSVLLLLSFSDVASGYANDGKVVYEGEKHLRNIRQLTFGGSNAEGYFSFDNKKLTYQATLSGSTNCDQIYQMDLNDDPRTQTPKRMSTGLGACTCSFFMGDDEHFLYAGTFHHVQYPDIQPPTASFDTCNPKKCLDLETIEDPKLRDLCNTSYTWDVFNEYDIFLADKYGNIVSRLTDAPGYDAEGVVSPDGKLIAYTSMSSGDLELWIMNADGSGKRQLTDTLGYDGGSFFSPDGKKLIFRASRPTTPEAIQKYKDLLSYDLVAPTEMELFWIPVDGSHREVQITHLGGANWAPYYHHDNNRIIFSTDHNNTAGFGAFDLWMIEESGDLETLERITWDDDQFDAFAMFSWDGKQLVWGSSRNASLEYDMNLFIADWVDPPYEEEQTTHATEEPMATSPSETTPRGDDEVKTTATKMKEKTTATTPKENESTTSVSVSPLSPLYLLSSLVLLSIRLLQ